MQYYCNPGFQLTGRANRTCQSDSTWEGDEPRCEKGGSGKRFDLYISVRHETDHYYRYFAMLRFIFCWLGICLSEIHAKRAKNDHPSECTGKQNINWISPLLRDHSHCKENHTIFSRPLKFQNTFLKWPCFYSRHSWNTVDTTWNAINSINHWSHRGLRSATSCGASLSRLWGDREVPLGESGPVPVSGGVHADGAPRQHAGPLYPSALGGTSDVLQTSVHVTIQIKNIIMANLIKLYYHFPNSVTLRFSERSKIFTLRS